MKMTNDQIRAKYPQTADRIIGERRVVRRLVRKAITDGYTVSVHCGESWEIKRSVSVQDIMDNIMATDSDRIYLTDFAGERTCHFYLIYGNSPAEVIADHTDTPYAQSLYDLATAGEE